MVQLATWGGVAIVVAFFLFVFIQMGTRISDNRTCGRRCAKLGFTEGDTYGEGASKHCRCWSPLDVPFPNEVPE